MPKKERAAKAAAFAMKQELDSEMTEEERARIEKSGMGVGKAGLNTGEEQLFGARARTREARPPSRRPARPRAAREPLAAAASLPRPTPARAATRRARREEALQG